MGAGGENVQSLPGVTLNSLRKPFFGRSSSIQWSFPPGVSRLFTHGDPNSRLPAIQVAGFCDGRVRPVSRYLFGLGTWEAYDLSILFAAGVLLGARLVEVFFYEWTYYGRHLWHVPAVWLGGMSTHGILLGAIAGVWVFCRTHGRNFLEIADELVIPGAFLMGVGRLGNFIDGQILGRVTDVWWAVKFPDAEGFRHPVVLYDGLKNLLLIPVLLVVRDRRPPRGILLALFVLCYGLLRIPIDLFREYPTTLLGVATGQSFNIFMTLLGTILLCWFARGSRADDQVSAPGKFRAAVEDTSRALRPRRIAFAVLLLVSLTMPSDWTQDVPARYGKRHPGMQHSWLHPPIASDAPAQAPGST